MLIASLTSAGAWVAYFRWKDRARPEPLWMLLCTALGGAMGAGLALFGFLTLEQAGIATEWMMLDGPWPEALRVSLTIGVVEELAKAVPVIVISRWSGHFDEWLDGAIYAGCAAIGFATVETAMHGWAGLDLSELWPRVLASPASHALFAGPMGLGIAAFMLDRRIGWLLLGTSTSMLAHAGYDLLLGRSGLPAPLSAGIVLVLWIGFVLAAPRLARAPVPSRAARAETGSGAIKLP